MFFSILFQLSQLDHQLLEKSIHYDQYKHVGPTFGPHVGPQISTDQRILEPDRYSTQIPNYKCSYLILLP